MGPPGTPSLIFPFLICFPDDVNPPSFNVVYREQVSHPCPWWGSISRCVELRFADLLLPLGPCPHAQRRAQGKGDGGVAMSHS